MKIIKILIRIIAILNLIVGVLAFPLVSIGLLFGIAGSTASYYWLMIIGYAAVIIFSAISLFRHKFFPGFICGYILLFGGMFLDARFWGKHNSNLCAELRANPTCKEDQYGFQCSNVGGHGFITGKSICD